MKTTPTGNRAKQGEILRFRVAGTMALFITVVASVFAQSIPEDRPRIRPASALAGWADWEKGKAIFDQVKVPPSPPLSPEEALKTFRVAPGYRLELFAAEPLIANPIFFEFDPDGRLWAIEYRGYMRDLAGTGEGDPICRIVVLEDTDADGRADRHTVFLDGLVMPRTFAFVKGGVLVAEPPRLWFCADLNGDLQCDQKRQVGQYGVGGNPQHTANGLQYGLDNWLHNSDWPKRHRFSDGKLLEQDTLHRGQFGGSFDDFGRFFTCYESSALHADFLPAEDLLRNPNLARLLSRRGGGRGDRRFGIAVNVAANAQEVFPIRPTPQITLGGLELRDDGRLRTYTVVSGSVIYNGHQFPEDAYGNAFIPEAGGHLIGRLKLRGDLEPRAARFYPAEEEFLASTDERFRPVNARVGPDGAFYIADMYHGIIEHVIFLVPWLTEQVKARNLETGNDMGRIWRMVAENHPIDRRAPSLSVSSIQELIGLLSHPNGWHRMTAQRLLIERNDPSAAGRLCELVQSGTDNSTRAAARGRIHALWTLDGLNALAWSCLRTALADRDEFVRATAARLTRRFTQDPNADEVLTALERACVDRSILVRLHALLALGEFTGDSREALMMRAVTEDKDELFQTAAASGLAGRELRFIERLLSHDSWRVESPSARSMLSLLGELLFEERDPAHLNRLLRIIEDQLSAFEWRGEALLDGLLNAAPNDLSRARPIELISEPGVLVRLSRSTNHRLVDKGYRLHQLVTWPGDTTLRTAVVNVQPLSDSERRLVEQGQGVYTLLCAPCHQPHGGGLANVAPPLNASDWIGASSERLVRIVLHGLYGPIKVNGEDWQHHMPGFGSSALTNDTEVAAVLSYVRRAWGNTYSTVDPALVSEVRRENRDREIPWTAAELSGVGASPARDAEAVIRSDAADVFVLPARFASTYGRRLKYNPTLDILAPWVEENDIAEWTIEVTTPGVYEVRVTLGADQASARDRFVIETSAGRIIGTVPDTGGNALLQEHTFGTLSFSAGRHRVLMRPEGKLRRELADVRSLRLAPVSRVVQEP